MKTLLIPFLLVAAALTAQAGCPDGGCSKADKPAACDKADKACDKADKACDKAEKKACDKAEKACDKAEKEAAAAPKACCPSKKAA